VSQFFASKANKFERPKLPKTGIVNIFTKHTSCGLSINENCDPDVRIDMETTQTGWIDTDLEQSVLPVIPMGKLIQPEDIAETILFLASEQARMLTGQVIKVSGGHAL
jgi:NAD(P)-dependent dehydrogenase (short-subunit alcohol dehydrogenase family)